MIDPADQIAPMRFDTRDLPADARLNAWQTALANFTLSRRETGPFVADAEVWLLDPLILTHARVAPVRYDRDVELIERDRNDHFALVYLVEGGFVGDYGEGVAPSGPGSLTALDMRRPCWTDAGQLEAYILSLPRVFLMPKLGNLEPHGIVAHGGLATLFGAAMRSIVAALPTLGRDQAAATARIIRDLVAETLLDAARTVAQRSERDASLVARVRDHIDDHLHEDLDVPAICAALGVSRSTLYRAFGGGGGVSQQVQRRRLNALRIRLTDPAETRNVGELAHAFGFVDKSHVTRLFKREYGCTPGRYRASIVDGTPLSTGEVPGIFQRWTKLLD
jgi:AraC-like DNA-binding protein